MNKKKYIHFIGIGGYGMSGIANILLNQHYKVSGSDIREGSITKKLSKMGAKIYFGHEAKNINNVQAVVISSAINSENPEIKKANELGIPIYNRAEMLQFLMSGGRSIAVAGTHGKTTTSSMLSFVMERGGLDPTVIVGGEMEEFGGNSKFGYGPNVVVEADESDGSFLYLKPESAIITNIDDDHLDYYQDSNHIMQTFKSFIEKIDIDGKLVLCSDCEKIRKVLSDVDRNYITYGFDEDHAIMIAKNVSINNSGSSYDLYKRCRKLGRVELSVPGKHNILNSIASITIAMEYGLDFSTAAKVIKDFMGVNRRFQTIGEINKMKIVDDYAHHPVEVKATLGSALQVSNGRTIAIFQPHRFSRTKMFYKEFANSLNPADIIIIDDIYAASEMPINGINSELIVEEIKKLGHKNVFSISGHEDILKYIVPKLKKDDLILTIGAGNITTLGPKLLLELKNKGGKNFNFAA